MVFTRVPDIFVFRLISSYRTETGVSVTAFEVTFHRSTAVPRPNTDEIDILLGESGGNLRTLSPGVFRQSLFQAPAGTSEIMSGVPGRFGGIADILEVMQ
jgi:hypothetical protein